MLQVFIDTNVYLTFYSLASEDLEELRKLHTAVENDALRLLVPQQTKDELERNRETRFAESLGHVRELRPKGGLPQMARDLPEAKDFLEAQKAFVAEVNSLESQLEELFDGRQLGADKVLTELLAAAKAVPSTPEILAAAKERAEVNNPPGKRGSLGDAINWESLLAEATKGDLHLVTGDGDYTSALSKEKVKPFLQKEWRSRKAGDVHIYRRISDFLKEQFPEIKVATELEKEIRIRALIESSSFATTHWAISRLQRYTDFTAQQAADLLEASLSNIQIKWIAGDHDVLEFFKPLVLEFAGELESDQAERVRGLFLDD